MSKKIREIVEDARNQVKQNDPSLRKLQAKKAIADKLAAKKSGGETPKNNSSVFAAKPEPNRGPGSSRHPSVPQPHITRPMGLGEDFSVLSVDKNGKLTAKGKQQMADYLEQQKQELRHKIISKHSKYVSHPIYGGKSTQSSLETDWVKAKKELEKHGIKEDAPAMASGAAGDPGAVQNPTANYASQKSLFKNIKTKMMRRKKPVGEGFEDGVGTTKYKSKKKAATPPGIPGSNGGGIPIGGQ